MKIAYVVPAFPMPSETFVFREVLGLLDRGISIEVHAVTRPSASELAVLPAAARELAEQVHYIDRMESAMALPWALTSRSARALNARLDREATLKANGLARLARAGAIARRLKASGAERIHAHWPYAAQMAALAHELTGVPFSVSVHAHEVAHDGGHFAAIYEKLEFASFCNRAAMEYLLERLPGSAEARSELNYHGVDLEQFALLDLAPPPPPLEVLAVGRLAKTKGMDRVVRAVGLAREEGLDVRLTVVGDGSQRGLLEEQARELGIADRVTFCGWIEHGKVREHLAACHVLALLPDIDFHEGLPNVVLEAQAAGRPVVLSPLPAATEVLVPGENGWTVSAPDAVGELVDVLRALLAEPSKLEEMHRRARSAVENGFDARTCLDRLCEQLGVTESP